MIFTSLAPAQEQREKSIAEIARENREACLRKSVEQTVNEMCSKADDPKMQESYPKIKEKCRDKPALVQSVLEIALKKLKAATEGNAKRMGEDDKSWVDRAMAAQTTPSDSVAAAQYDVDKACNYGVSAKPAEVLECAKAEGKLATALRSQTTTQGLITQSAPARPSDYVVSLWGTTGLAVTGTCSFAGKATSFDDVLPAEHTVAGGRGVLCSFVKKYVQGTLRMQIIQNGVVRDQAETEASYGTVSLSVDW
jgi:hypothetical protein